MHEWIPVKRRLPPPLCPVLVSSVTGEVFEAEYMGDEVKGFITATGPEWLARPIYHLGYILAWMPLPEHYKEENDDERGDDEA